MNIEDVLKFSKNELKNVDNPILESYMIAGYVLGKERIDLSLNLEQKVSTEDFNKIKSLIVRRRNNEPIAYILGEKNFYGYDFLVDEGVLVPRFDTEVLVEKTLEILAKSSKKKLFGLEIGIGTGIISLSLLKNENRLRMDMIDINMKAIENSKKNAKSLNLTDRVSIFLSDIYQNISNKYDFIISNPPYIEKDDINKLSEQIKNYEPINALDGGEDGLDFYRRILSDTKYLEKDGFYAFEIGYNQAKDVKKLLEKKNFHKNKIFKDYNGLDRVVIGMKI